MATIQIHTCETCCKSFERHPTAHKPKCKYCSIECYRVFQRSPANRPGPRGKTNREPCAHCGKTVYRKRSVKRTGEEADRMFCNRDCYDNYRSAIIEARKVACKQCGLDYVSSYCEQQYCSAACRGLGLKARPKHCVNCGCYFTALIYQKKRHVFIGANKPRTCSSKCHIEWISNNEERKRKISRALSGSKHPNWQGGKARLNNISYRGPGWQRQRKKVLKRDGWKCVDCGITNDECIEKYGRSLDVDHIEPYHNFTNSRLANKLPNLASRCASCHKKSESKRTNIQQVLPFGDSEKRLHKGFVRGEKVNTAKLTEEDVRTIRKRVANNEAGALIAREYGVAKTAIYAIKNRKTWKHVN